MTEPLLNVKQLSISFPAPEGKKAVVQKVSFGLEKGKVLAIVGESGSGKTMIARSVLGLLPSGGTVTSGSIEFQGTDLVGMSQKHLRSIRGTKISMIFQEPMASLNPALKIGYQMCEAAKYHTSMSATEIRERALELLRRVRIRDAESCLGKYPHEFSGGMRQRIMIASALMLKPALLIADEPTTALDCIVQKEVLDIMLEVTREEGTAVLFISHDLGLVAHYADKILVMKQGKQMETGIVSSILNTPSHAYTRSLLAALPRPKQRSPFCEGTPMLRVRDLAVEYPERRTWFWKKQNFKQVLFDINFDVLEGETLAIVGESGSGKSTLGRAILQLLTPCDGLIELNGETLFAVQNPNFKALRKVIQPIFQDPYATLSPRRTIGQSLAEPLKLDKQLENAEIQSRVEAILGKVHLPSDFSDRFPHELSGGQRQRVAIARALINEPKLVIADEPVSALDITVQAEILKLLDELKKSLGFTLVFISHDLGVVEQIADNVLIMQNGRILEEGPSHAIFSAPAHSYTRQLLEALPELRQIDDNRYALNKRSFSPIRLKDGFVEYSNKQKGPPIRLRLSTGHIILAVKAAYQGKKMPVQQIPEIKT